ncbi:MAG: beta-galactosidase [Clostridia bacterium]|nr:beta-galactosidase [Clostridia bacterium]
MTFTYKNKDFLLDGKPFRIISGAMHYFRIVPEYWEDRLKKLRACGFNTVETYVAWNLHERREGEFDFSGGLDVVRYIEIAESLGLNVIVRPGPYICSEFELGGLPSWLLADPSLRLRCSDPAYLAKVRPYYRELLTRLRPHLCTNGGRIIMLQVENEYGAYGDDKDYLRSVADMYREFGIDCELFTSDGPAIWELSGGTLPDLLSTANFGSKPAENFRVLNAFKPDQPTMCAEFWTGWFDRWGEGHHVRSAEDIKNNVRTILGSGASFNFYMFHGGTNFGFTNGANHEEGKYHPIVTSYDYCAPLSESGDLTENYFAVRGAIAEFTGKMPELDVENSRKAAYGRVSLTERAPLLENYEKIGTKVKNAAPLTMEEVGQDFGYIMYSTTVIGPQDERELGTDVHDRAHFFIDGKPVGVRERTGRWDDVTLSVPDGETRRLDILVENCGRINYGERLFDRKGLVGGVKIGYRFHFGWEITPLTMDDLSSLSWNADVTDDGRPAFLRGTLTLDGEPADTFLRTDGFGRGFVKINGFNLGRFDCRGPQKTLFVPAPVLHEGENEITVFVTDGYSVPCVEFTDTPDLGEEIK